MLLNSHFVLTNAKEFTWFYSFTQDFPSGKDHFTYQIKSRLRKGHIFDKRKKKYFKPHFKTTHTTRCLLRLIFFAVYPTPPCSKHLWPPSAAKQTKTKTRSLFPLQTGMSLPLLCFLGESVFMGELRPSCPEAFLPAPTPQEELLPVGLEKILSLFL